MTIAYKIVRPGTRESWTVSPPYKRIYSEGAIIESDAETLGIFCFETREKAYEWLYGGLSSYMILRVRGIGKGVKPQFIIRLAWLDGDLQLEHYKKFLKDNENVMEAPKGTICFKSVEVLE